MVERTENNRKGKERKGKEIKEEKKYYNSTK